MGDEAPAHIPVLTTEVVEYLQDAAGDILVDCTLGLGGHARHILEANSRLHLVGLDLDAANLGLARDRLSAFADRMDFVQANFGDLGEVLRGLGKPRVGGILADLGFSSNQLADPSRGLSFETDGPLDMRLDRSRGPTAADLVNTLAEGELSDLLYIQSQERHSRRIARRICEERRRVRVDSTAVLARLVASAVGRDLLNRPSRIHPATRTFLALRMTVNQELTALRRLLDQAPACLVAGGRLAVITFHSGEDRIVKEDFRARARAGQYRLLTRRPVAPGEEEQRLNPRSRSAKLRVAELVAGA